MDHASFEEKLERNPLRGFVREYFEVKPLKDISNPGRIDQALHYCSRNGTGTALIHKYFAPTKIAAVDPDSKLVGIARESLAGLPITVAHGSLTRLDYDDSSFDAVFVLGELHNYPEWRDCLNEIARVTKPGGRFFIEELSIESFEYALGRYFKAKADHRYDAMLHLDEFRDAVQASGFSIERFDRRRPFGLFSYFLMAARKRVVDS
ncbi:MAG: class I SAM-dependent methyltransferase [Spirochaetia bacterium]|jgi:ubiquinone/menaquinone biosynthesis C-methylase UbiE|nr:class I SAM-dependent methyltransferase [Spirochaetia bacterium]